MKKAIIFGATGLVGSNILSELLERVDYQEVIIVTRTMINIKHKKLTVIIGNLNILSNIKNQLIADEVFIALGSSERQIDHDYPVLAARYTKELGAKSIFIVTAVGADPNSKVAYLKTKGKIEREIIALDFDHSHFFRVSMIMGKRAKFRLLERLIMRIWSLMNLLLSGKLSKFKGTRAEDIASAMVNSARQKSNKINVYHWLEMENLNQKTKEF